MGGDREPESEIDRDRHDAWSRQLGDPVPEEKLNRLTAAVEETVSGAGEPLFYALAGSHAYGFAGPASDLDVRGVHLADGRRYALLDRPDAQLEVERPAPAAAVDIDLVSYELRKFGALLAARNVNVLEVVLAAPIVSCRHPDALETLRQLLETALPMDVPSKYAAMARHLFDRHLRDVDPDDVAPKHLLYTLRAVLAAEHLAEEGILRADLFDLVEQTAVEVDLDLLDTIVADTRGLHSATGADLEAARAHVESTLTSVDIAGSSVNTDATTDAIEDFSIDLDRWMWSVRGWTD